MKIYMESAKTIGIGLFVTIVGGVVVALIIDRATVLPGNDQICARKNVVEAHSMVSKFDERVIEIISVLNDRGCRAIGPIVPPEYAKTSRSEIRIFHLSDKEDASIIAKLIEEQTGIRLHLRDMSDLLGHKVPVGKLEIWIN